MRVSGSHVFLTSGCKCLVRVHGIVRYTTISVAENLILVSEQYLVTHTSHPAQRTVFSSKFDRLSGVGKHYVGAVGAIWNAAVMYRIGLGTRSCIV